MKINKVGSSNIEASLYDTLSRRNRITKEAFWGVGLKVLLQRLAGYGGTALLANEAFSRYNKKRRFDFAMMFEGDYGEEIAIVRQKLREKAEQAVGGVANICFLSQSISSQKSNTSNKDPAAGTFIPEKKFKLKMRRYSDYENLEESILKISSASNCDYKKDVEFIANMKFSSMIAAYRASKNKATDTLGMIGDLIMDAGPILSFMLQSAVIGVTSLDLSQAGSLFAGGFKQSGRQMQNTLQDYKVAAVQAVEYLDLLVAGLVEDVKNCKKILRLYRRNKSEISDIIENKKNLSDVKQQEELRNFIELSEAAAEYISTLQNIFKTVAADYIQYQKNKAQEEFRSQDPYGWRASYQESNPSEYDSISVAPEYGRKKGERGVQTSIGVLNIQYIPFRQDGVLLNSYGVRELVADHVRKIFWIEQKKEGVPLLQWIPIFTWRSETKMEYEQEKRHFYRYVRKNTKIIPQMRESIDILNRSEINRNPSLKEEYISQDNTEYINDFSSFFNALQYIILSSPVNGKWLKRNLSIICGQYITDSYLNQLKSNKDIYYDGDLVGEYNEIMKYHTKDGKNFDRNRKNYMSNKYSTNKNKSLVKNADNFSDQYYKDALTGPNNSDPLLNEFYKSMQEEHNRRAEPRDQRKDLYSSREEEDITNMAHPKSIKVSDSIKDGGLVENGHEQKKKSLEVANKTPTGNFIGNYAWMRKYLIK